MTILDKKIKPGKRPLTCLDVDQAREFEGKKCFMASGLSYFNDLSRFEFEDIKPFNASVGKLLVIDDLTDHVFYNADTKLAYRCVLPCEWVEQKNEITFEPYTLETFENEFNIGDVVMFRGKSNTDRAGSNYKCVYSGYRIFNETCSINNAIVILGLWGFQLSELFDLYEIYRDGNWEPFGRKVENIDICAGS